MKLILLLFLIASLQAYAQPKLVIPLGHTHKITVAAFSPDGKRLVTGSADKTLKIWDVETGRLLADLKGHIGEITSISFNQSGDRIISTASLDSSAILWNANTGKMIRAISPSRYYVDFATFSPDGSKFFVHQSRSIYDSRNGEELKSLPGYSSVDQAFFTRDSKKILLAESSAINLYDIETGESLKKFKGSEPIALSADNSKLVTSSYDKKAIAWDLATGDSLFSLEGITEKPTQLHISPSGTSIVVYGISSGKFQLNELKGGKMLADLGPGLSSHSVNFSSDGKRVYLGASYMDTKVWEISASQARSIPSQGRLISISPNGQVLFDINDKTSIMDPDVATRTLSDRLSFAVFNEKGNRFFGVDANGFAGVWLADGEPVSRLKGFNKALESIRATPDRSLLDIGFSKEQNLLQWQNGILKPVEDAMNDELVDAVFSSDGHYMVSIQVNEKKTSPWDPDQKLSLWDLSKRKLITENLWRPGMQDITIHNQGSHVFSPDGSKFYTWNELGYGYIFETATGKLLKELKSERLWYSFINPSFTRVLFQVPPADFDKPPTTSLVDVQSGQTINQWNFSSSGYEKLKFLKSSESFLVYDESIHLYNEKSKKPVLTIPNGENSFNRGEDQILVERYDMVGVWDLAKGKKIFETKAPENVSFWAAAWNKKEDQVIYSTNDGKIYFNELATGHNVHSLDIYATRIIVDTTGDHIFAIYKEGVTVLNAEGKLIAQLKGHQHNVISAMYIPDLNKFLTVGEDNTARVWNPNGEMLYTYLLLGKDIQFTSISSGEYMANPEAARQLHFIDGDLNVISFDQLDVKYNRPDLVLKKLDPSNSALISSYHKAWQKRLKKLGMDSTRLNNNFTLPQLEISNRDQVKFEQAGDEIVLNFRGSDSVQALQRFNIWVNESPLFGTNGLSIAGRRMEFDTSILVKLSPGPNYIEASVSNVAGGESYKQPLELNCLKTASGSKVYFLGFGVDTYDDPKYNLLYSINDIRGLAAALREKLGEELVVDTIFNEKFTTSTLNTLKKKLEGAGINDKVIVAYSGHGLLSRDFDYYLSTSATHFDEPEKGGIAYEKLEDLFDRIPPRQKLLLIDACHSGEVDKEELTRINSLSKGLIKGLKPVAYKEGNLGLKNSFELMQSLFVNVGKSTGATIISAAAGTQFALEKNELENGVFTYSILELMARESSATINELKKWVSSRVVELTNGLQRPTFQNENRVVDWKLW
jgi:WD40 repeat protein